MSFKRTYTAAFFGMAALSIAAVLWIQSVTAAEDSRELVKMPPMMQAHMLKNMREHLETLDSILANLAEGDTDAAAEIAEKRLGMSSMSMHGAHHMAPLMPEAMRAFGGRMHRAASRFVIVARDAELDPGVESQRKVYKALQAITENCNGCHQAYRIR